MSQAAEPAIRVGVDPTNPGQFFACCGLLELAERFWCGAAAWFDGGSFCVHPIADPAPVGTSAHHLLDAVAGAALQQVDPDDDYSSPVELPAPFNLRLDWWRDSRAGGSRLKVWAGSMRNVRIARAMQNALGRRELQNEAMFDHGTVVYDTLEPTKKVEPFYFDGRRGSNAQSRDIGFSPDSLQMRSQAYPAVEFLCLVGLQRFRPMATERPRMFVYHSWNLALPANVAACAVCGQLPQVASRAFRFENAFRTDQRKHKGFVPATPLVWENKR